MDLVISSADASFLMIIENKIDSGETREDQVVSYLAWLERQTHWKRPAVKLIYLTVDGCRAERADPDKYVCLSYREDIRLWLREVVANIHAVRLSQVVNQYLEVVDKLSQEAGGWQWRTSTKPK